MKKLRKSKAKRLVIWAAKGMFNSARKLKEALQPETQRKVLIIRSMDKVTIRKTDIFINWGNSQSKYFFWGEDYPPIINHPYTNSRAVNKLKTFQALQGKCNIPEWTTDSQIAFNWLMKEHKDIICRETVTGFGGKGITYCVAKQDLLVADCPLYVQYKKKKKEFRVHVFNGEVIDVTQKKKRKDFDGEINTKIRNYGNGWVYCREDIVEPEDLREQAIKAVQTLGLNFGAVDCIWNEKENKTYVLEANTAPGLEGTTIEAYKKAVLGELNGN